MHHFVRRDGALWCEDVALHDVAAHFGTPTYVYSAATLRRHFRVFDEAFSDVDHLVCYAVKANGNLAVLRLLRELGSGFDIVSGGELHRARLAGADPGTVVFSGVGKTADEIALALQAGILALNVESAEELVAVEAVARGLGVRAPIGIRVNPDVDARTHPYIATGLRTNKFGVPIHEARQLYERARTSPHLAVTGVACHIGSQLTDTAPFVDAMDRVLALVASLRSGGIAIHHIDFGGGLGIPYSGEDTPSPASYGRAITARLGGSGLRLILEPGRVIVGNAGVLLTRVLYRKPGLDEGAKSFVVVDAGMNDAIRPTLYQAHHTIEPVAAVAPDAPKVVVDVVGPVCETGDFLARDRALPWPAQGDLLAVMSAGAYGMAMASQYNARPRAAEVLVDGDVARLVRRRETLHDLVEAELETG